MRRCLRVVPCFALVLTTGLGAGIALGVGASPAGASAARGTDASWARGVCGAVTGWLGSVTKAAAAGTSTSVDPSATKKTLDAMLRSADAATAKLIKQLKSAGTPATGGGAQLVPVAKEQFTQIRRVIATARTTIAAVPTTDAAFKQKVVTAQGGLESGLEAVQSAFGAATFGDVAPLIGVFTASASCRSAVALPGGLTVTPSVVAPGHDISIAPSGVDAAALTVCTQASAFKTELLDADGARIAVGARNLTVPPDAKAGADTVRLVCYLPDQVGRRVITGLCAAVTVGAGAAPTASSGCPATPRLVFGQGVINAESTLSRGFNRLVG